MSDQSLRELERAAATGDVEAHGKLLQNKVRLGQLDTERLELLAYLHWPPAWVALGWVPHGHSGAPSEGFRSRLFKRDGQDQLYEVFVRFERWAHGLARWGAPTALRIGAAAARHRWPSWEAQYDALATKGWDMPCPKERIYTLMHMVDLQISKPGEYPLVYRTATYPLYEPAWKNASTYNLEHEGRALASSGPVTRAFGELGAEDPRIVPTTFGNLGIFAGRRNYHWLAEALTEACDTDSVRDAAPCRDCGRVWGEHQDGHRDHEFVPVLDEAAWCRHVQRREESVYQAIRDELVPWALGDRDPVLERIEREARTYVDASGDSYPGDAP